MGFGGYSGGYSPPQRIEPSYGVYNPLGGGGFGGGGMSGFNPFGGGGYGGGMGGYGGDMGGFNPFGGGGYGGGYGTQFGGYDMGGGGGGGFGGYGGGMRAPAYEPTINDAFSNYFSQQYYGGNAFNPFAATSMFGGGGYGGGFGGGGRRGGGRRRRQQMFELDQPPQMQPQFFDQTPPPPQMAPGYGNAPPSPVYGGDQRVSIMPVPEQDTPVQSAPMFYEPPQMQSYAPSPFVSPFSRPGRDMFTDSFGYGMR